MNEMAIGLYRKAVATVCVVCGVGESEMLCSNMEACVDARYVLVKALSLYLTDTEIACMMGKTRQCVNGIRNSRKMVRWSVQKCLEEVGKKMI